MSPTTDSRRSSVISSHQQDLPAVPDAPTEVRQLTADSFASHDHPPVSPDQSGMDGPSYQSDDDLPPSPPPHDAAASLISDLWSRARASVNSGDIDSAISTLIEIQDVQGGEGVQGYWHDPYLGDQFFPNSPEGSAESDDVTGLRSNRYAHGEPYETTYEAYNLEDEYGPARLIPMDNLRSPHSDFDSPPLGSMRGDSEGSFRSESFGSGWSDAEETDASQQAAAATAGTPSTSERTNAPIPRTLGNPEQSMLAAELSSQLDDILESIPMTDADLQHWRTVLSDWSFDVDGGNGNTARGGEQLFPRSPVMKPGDENLSFDELAQKFGLSLSPPPSLQGQGFDMDIDDDTIAELRRLLMDSDMNPENGGNGASDFDKFDDFDWSGPGYNNDNTQRRFGGANASQLFEEISHAHDIADDHQVMRRLRSWENLRVPTVMDLAREYEGNFRREEAEREGYYMQGPLEEERYVEDTGYETS
ncbi:hypothetical protein I350_03175 [Cryptococcus amylolentus CBS 6273]|uniref:Uncharacterized protein n=1 Tax=Cryptococcus amylolentus CBS 6273 TaxID=1296118 RepID=A0A1E3KBD3_9TREE|nr:hypothetical protein I350_03175 [Cryptococcus amylolentus CBS 6273]